MPVFFKLHSVTHEVGHDLHFFILHRTQSIRVILCNKSNLFFKTAVLLRGVCVYRG